MKTIFMLFVLMVTTNIFSFSQSADISGILKTQGEYEQYNSICIRFENSITDNDQSVIRTEFSKYHEIVTFGFKNESDANYIIIKYSNPMTPNQLLGILDKVNKQGHYMNSGSAVYYQKDGSIYFIR